MMRIRSGWPWVVALLGLSAMALAAFFFRETRAIPGDLLESGRSIAEAFRTGTVTSRFVSYATEVNGSQRLQFATLDEMEVFERTDRTTVLWGQLALPDVVVRAEAPVSYTYYLDLEGRWEFTIADHVVLVEAPPIRSNTPAIDISRIRYDVKSRSILRNEDEAVENLRRGLTALAKKRASENVSLVRELGRRKTEDFVRTWLLSSYEDAARYRVTVVFADESPPPLTR